MSWAGLRWTGVLRVGDSIHGFGQSSFDVIRRTHEYDGSAGLAGLEREIQRILISSLLDPQKVKSLAESLAGFVAGVSCASSMLLCLQAPLHQRRASASPSLDRFRRRFPVSAAHDGNGAARSAIESSQTRKSGRADASVRMVKVGGGGLNPGPRPGLWTDRRTHTFRVMMMISFSLLIFNLQRLLTGALCMCVRVFTWCVLVSVSCVCERVSGKRKPGKWSGKLGE